MACIICSTESLKSLPMDEEKRLAQAVREIVDGMVTTAQSTSLKTIKISAPRCGICIVECCAQNVEAPCGRATLAEEKPASAAQPSFGPLRIAEDR